MEAWRRELYHCELYHYGVKGMKWGHHKTPLYTYSDTYDGKIDKAVGMYTQSKKKNPYPHSLQVGITRGKGGTQLYLHNTRNNTYMKSGETNTGRVKGIFKTSYAEDGARYSINLSRLKSQTVGRAKRAVDKIYRRAQNIKVSNWTSAVSKRAKKTMKSVYKKLKNIRISLLS